MNLSPGIHLISFNFEGIQRNFLLHLPSKLDVSLPVVFMLHGAGGTAKMTSQKYGWTEKADHENFAVIFPEALRKHMERPPHFKNNPQVWNDGSGRGFPGEGHIPDVEYLSAIIDYLPKIFNVDTRRIYFTGFSNGASMAFKMAIERAEKVAAIGPVMGYFWPNNRVPNILRPLLFIVGDADPLHPIEGGQGRNPWGFVGAERLPMITIVHRWLEYGRIDFTPHETDAHKNFTRMYFNLNDWKDKNDKEKIVKLSSNFQLIYYILHEHGHEWPGFPRLLPFDVTGPVLDEKIFNATDIIWDFFKPYSI